MTKALLEIALIVLGGSIAIFLFEASVIEAIIYGQLLLVYVTVRKD